MLESGFKIRWFEVTREMQESFKTNPRDTGISAHAFTVVCDMDKEIRDCYTEDFGMINGRLWVKFRPLLSREIEILEANRGA
jgi:hypothetical protein